MELSGTPVPFVSESGKRVSLSSSLCLTDVWGSMEIQLGGVTAFPCVVWVCFRYSFMYLVHRDEKRFAYALSLSLSVSLTLFSIWGTAWRQFPFCGRFICLLFFVEPRNKRLISKNRNCTSVVYHTGVVRRQSLRKSETRALLLLTFSPFQSLVISPYQSRHFGFFFSLSLLFFPVLKKFGTNSFHTFVISGV